MIFLFASSIMNHGQRISKMLATKRELEDDPPFLRNLFALSLTFNYCVFKTLG